MGQGGRIIWVGTTPSVGAANIPQLPIKNNTGLRNNSNRHIEISQHLNQDLRDGLSNSLILLKIITIYRRPVLKINLH